jgi:hypothetical protein
MAHPLGSVNATLNQVAKEMTQAQLQIAIELKQQYQLGPDSLNAVIIALATNVQTMMLPKPKA